MELTIEQNLQRGIEAHQQGNLKEAERLYRAILRSMPRHPQANHNLGLIAVSVDKNEDAIALLKNAVDESPRVEQFWFNYVNTLIKTKNLTRAQEAISKVQKNGIASAEFTKEWTQLKKAADGKAPSQFEIADLLHVFNDGQLKSAETLAISMTKKFPEHEIAWKVLGAVMKRTGRLQESLIPNEKAVELSPDDAEAHTNLGITLQELGRLDAAMVSYQRAIELKSESAKTYNNLGVIKKQLGEMEAAEYNYRKAIELQPNYAEAHNNLGIVHRDQGQIEVAEISYRKAIELQPNYAEAHNNLGITLHEMGRLQEAKISLAQAVSLKSKYANAHLNLSKVLRELGDVDAAILSCKNAILSKDDLPEAHQSLGELFQQIGRYAEAKLSFEKTILLKPNYAEAYDDLGVTLQAMGLAEEAEECYRQYAFLEPTRAPKTISKARTLFEQGNYEKALELSDSYNTFYSRSYSLDCLFSLGKTADIYQRLEETEDLDAHNLQVAAFAAFMQGTQKKTVRNKFCFSPLDYIYFSNISKHVGNTVSFVTKVIGDLNSVPKVWQPSAQSVRKGFQTSSDLFNFPKENIIALKTIIYHEIDMYYEKFREKDCTFINDWPSQKKIKGWHVVLKEQGYNTMHIHQDGWLSGVIYLKVVPPLGKDEGAIKFSLGNPKFPEVVAPEIIHNPNAGDIVLFPSSLYHGTVPFSTNSERIIVSFDLMPQ